MADVVNHYLNSYQYETAMAVARVLVAEDPRSETRLHSLANVHVRRGEWKIAHELLKGFWSAENRYLRGVVCLHLSLYHEAEEALLKTGPAAKRSTDSIPNGAAGWNLLGKIAQRANRPRQAIEYYKKSLEMDPLMWASKKCLCDLGDVSAADEDPLAGNIHPSRPRRPPPPVERIPLLLLTRPPLCALARPPQAWLSDSDQWRVRSRRTSPWPDQGLCTTGLRAMVLVRPWAAPRERRTTQRIRRRGTGPSPRRCRSCKRRR